MRLINHFDASTVRRVAVGITAVILLAACSGAAPQAAAPAASTALPVTGLASPTGPPAAVPVQDTQEPSGTQAAASQADTAQPAQAGSTAPQCTSPAVVSPALTEGPYFKANSPERTSLLEPGMTGTKLTLTGYVLTPDCQPVANALVDFWQANAEGQYDNSGYTLRGHQFTDANGRYQLETVVPGLYPGRTEHIHVKIQAPNGPVLTTQLFFPGVADNQGDGIFDPGLVIDVQDTGSGSLTGTFTFIVNPG